MGRYYFGAKTTVEQATKLSIFKLKEFGLFEGLCRASTLTWTHRFSGHQNSIGIVVYTGDNPYVKVNYTTTDRGTGKKTDYDYKIQLTTTSCYFGGIRYWFICPLCKNGVYCGRRAGTLYLASGGNYFGCRHCYNLSYDSRNECRLGRIGQLGYLLKYHKQYEDIYNSIKRWTWQGKPTKKVQKLKKLERKINQMPLSDINPEIVDNN